MGTPLRAADRWFDDMSEQDRSFIRRFILCSGSLKELAKAYEVTYPTIRLRLDRLIAKIEMLSSAQQVSEFERVLQASYVDGKIDNATFRQLRQAHQASIDAGEGE